MIPLTNIHIYMIITNLLNKKEYIYQKRYVCRDVIQITITLVGKVIVVMLNNLSLRICD